MVSVSAADLTCLCGAISEPGDLLSSSEIPISTSICHCNACRYTSGSLGPSFTALNGAPPRNAVRKLTQYSSSPSLTRYFCSICGCHCFLFDHVLGTWYCLGGIIESSPPAKAEGLLWPKNTVKIIRHDYVLDTVDGGLAPTLLTLGIRSIPADLPHDTILSLPRKSTALPRPSVDDLLSARCHCAGVSLLIKRANYTASPETPARYIPSDPTKYLTYMCACSSCRLSTGVSLTPWALIPPSHVFTLDPAIPVKFGRNASNSGLTLAHHWSSPDTCRSFCSKCGATIFYWCEKRPEELDIAVGILRDEGGSLAKRWLEWEWGRCSFLEEGIDRENGDHLLGTFRLQLRQPDHLQQRCHQRSLHRSPQASVGKEDSEEGQVSACYNDYEKFQFAHAQKPYLEFPILTDGAYDTGADRVIIGSISTDYQSAVYCATITHDGSTKNGFMECKDDTVNPDGSGTYERKLMKGSKGKEPGPGRKLLDFIDM